MKKEEKGKKKIFKKRIEIYKGRISILHDNRLMFHIFSAPWITGDIMAKKAAGCKIQTAEIFFGTKRALEFTNMYICAAFFFMNQCFCSYL